MIDQSEARVIIKLMIFAKVASAIVVTVGAVVFMGWLFNIAILTSIHPAWPRMVPNTAVSFFLLGVSLWLLQEEFNELSIARYRLGQVFATIVVILSGLTLAEYLFGWQLFIDELFSRELFGAIEELKPLRMAPHTALDFFLLGWALLLLNVQVRRGLRPAQFLALAGTLVGLLTLVGYIYGAPSFVGTMAIHTNVSFFLLSAGVLCTRPDRGLMATAISDTAGGILVRRLTPAIIGIPVIFGWLILWGERGNFYGVAFGMALFTILLIAVFAVLLLLNSELLHRIDVERKRATELGDALNEIDSVLNSTLDIAKIMRKVVIDATKAIGSETAVIFLRENDHWIPRYHYGFSEELAAKRFTDEELPIAALTARHKKLIIVNDALQDERVNKRRMQEYKIRSFLSVPLLSKETVIGVLYFSYHQSAVPFAEVQVDFARKLGASLTLAIENARLYEAQHNIADTLQEALITMPAKISGIDFGYLYRSATEAARVGGDFYDLFEIEPDRIGIVIGDVSGKGLGSAALTAVVKNSLRAYSCEQECPPWLVMERTNQLVCKMSGPATFVTVFFGILDVRTAVFTYCNAGHLPALVKRKGRSTVLLHSNSMVIGIIPGTKYDEAQTSFSPDDTLILYTDGITEARRGKDLFGEERLLKLIESLETHKPTLIPKLILREISSFTGGELSDDVAILAVSLISDH